MEACGWGGGQTGRGVWDRLIGRWGGGESWWGGKDGTAL